MRDLYEPLYTLVQRGGPVMAAILALSVVLYSRCFKVLLELRRARRAHNARAYPAETRLRRVALEREETREAFHQQRIAIGAMIAAAPLMGLLGTVSGMVTTFESISGGSAEKTMAGLARGISEVLVATESGLVVAIPALMLLHAANRSLRKYMQTLNRMEQGAWLEAES
ncbi:MAG TPA: MotA/TolQ/ExbB proton channel family protein [Opitutaceae bacterium]|jgi:biopolymer transport protein ExbB/TolQ